MAGRVFTDIIDDGGGGGAADGQLWSSAWTSLDDYLTNGAPAAGDVVAFGHNSVDDFTYSAAKVYTSGIVNGIPIALISCTQGVGSVSGLDLEYTKSSTNQIGKPADGTHKITIDDSWELEGIQIHSGNDIVIDPNSGGVMHTKDCTFIIGPNDEVNFKGTAAKIVMDNLTISCEDDSGASSGRVILAGGPNIEVNGLVFTNASNRSDEIILCSGGGPKFTGVDFSNCTNGAGVDLISGSSADGLAILAFSKAPTSFNAIQSSSSFNLGRILVVATGNADTRYQMQIKDDWGELATTTGNKRTGGAENNGVGYSWGGVSLGIETTAICSRSSPFYTEWIYGNIATAEAKTFTIFVMSSGVTLTKDKMWPELQVKVGSSDGTWTFVDDKDSVVIAGTVLSSDASTWTDGTGTKSKLVINATPGTTGLFRMRVGIGEPSMLAADDTYIDPAVFVT